MQIQTVLVVGAGLMGSGVVQVSLMAGYSVILVDIEERFIESGVTKVTGALQKLEQKNLLGGKTAADLLQHLSRTTNLQEAAACADIMVEAVVEQMPIKQQVFRTVADHAPEHCILASNTSTMSITEIASGCSRPASCVGIHFFNPVPVMRLVEVIAGEKSLSEAMDAAVQWAQSLPVSKGIRVVPRVLRDRPGFIANRVMAPVNLYMAWAFDTAAARQIPWAQLAADTILPGYPMDQLSLADFVGLDTMYHIISYYGKTLSPAFKPGKVLADMMAAKRLGQKTKVGFFDWTQGKPQIDLTQKAGIVDSTALLAIQANEGCRLLEEGVVTSWAVIDAAIEAGYNCPGPMAPAVEHYRVWAPLLTEIAQKVGIPYLEPCALFQSGEFIARK